MEENKITFGRIGYILCGGIEIIVKYRKAGIWNDELFRGTDEKLHEPRNRELHNLLEELEVTFIGVDGSALLIGVDNN